ncbi:MAG TPA: riboflavin synthase [Candidatus Binatia bacterium]|nr:riboflavin synthase [Candidatus Binatia bacterium]
MFTGLIEDVGKITSLQLNKKSAVLTVETRLPLNRIEPGASIAINGACLTVVKKRRRTFTVDVSPETLDRTSLSTLGTGSLVNLERSLRLQDRLGGHLVTGHVDGLGLVEAIKQDGDFIFFSFRVPAPIGALLVTKGSVAIDGISLTVNECGRLRFSVAIIPFTLRHTNLRARRVGDKVNIETDLIGKYVYKFLQQRDKT